MKNLGKIFLIVLAGILVLLILGLTALFFFVKNFDADKYKPQVVSAMEEALGRDVALSGLKLNLSLSQGVRLEAAGLTIMDDPRFSTGPFLSIDSVKLGLDILGIIAKREISISSVEVSSPRLVLIRNDQGLFNVLTLKFLSKDSTPLSAGRGEDVSSQAGKTSVALAAVLVKDIMVRNGNVILNDHLDEERALEVKKIDLKISEFSLIRPFKLSGQAALFGEKQNLSAAGTASVDVLGAALVFKTFQAKVSAESMDVDALEKLAPELSQGRLKNPLAGQLDVSATDVRVNAKGLAIGKASGKFVGGEAHTAYLVKPISNIEGKFDITGQDLNISESRCAIGGGRVEATAFIKDYAGAQNYAINLKMANLSVKEAIHQPSTGVTLDGLVFFETALTGQGLANISSLAPVAGTANLMLTQGKLENINVLRLVLEKMSMLPKLIEKLDASLPEKYKEKLNQDFTELKVVKLDMRAKDGAFAVDPADIETDIFSIAGTGTLDLHMNTQMQTKISIPADLSKSMADAVPELGLLINKDGQIVIPLMIQGKIPDGLSFMPDLEYLGRQLFEAEGRKQLDKVLDKVFKKSGGPESPDGTSTGNPNAEAAKEILGNVLDSIFKK